MSKQKPPKKKVVVTTRNTKPGDTASAPQRRSKTATSITASKSSEPLALGRQNYIWMGIGVALIIVGMALMSGGKMPSPDVWDDSIIYSFRRTVLAPFLILAGLVVEIYAIFK